MSKYYEYSSAANIHLPDIPIVEWKVDENFETSRVEILNLSDKINTPYKATSPNLQAMFIYIKANEPTMIYKNATSFLFHVVRGSGNFENIRWKKGDVFTSPFQMIELKTNEDSILYCIHDEPLLNYLNVAPCKKLFSATLYSKEEMENNMRLLTAENDLEKNRNGILLGHEKTKDGTKTITPTLWALYNKLPKNHFQKPHRHNSVAIDYCIFAKGKVYTLIGKELNKDGSIKDPVKMYWETGKVFTTPPGLWHSHHNEEDVDAYILPLQDAGLYTYQRTLDIQFVE